MGRSQESDVVEQLAEAQRKAEGMQVARPRRKSAKPSNRSRPNPNPLTVRDVLQERKVDGIWDPNNTRDLTVHLKLPVQEDLEEDLEEFCRLQRLGDFTSARKFFDSNLQDHLNKPYILIGYAEMLLEQGDYNTFAKINGSAISSTGSDIRDKPDGVLLLWYWELMREFVSCHKPDVFLNSPVAPWDFILEGLGSLCMSITQSMTQNSDEEGNISSTEIKILALAHRLGALTDITLQRRLNSWFPPRFYRSLYSKLLREGRIWDLRDIVLARILDPDVDTTSDWSDAPSCQERVDGLIADWSGVTQENDASTILAIIDILTSFILDELMSAEGNNNLMDDILDQSAPLVYTIIEKYPNSMRSRPFMRWMLAKSRLAHIKSSNYTDSLLHTLQSSPGVTIHPKRTQLPRYIPLHAENPGWITDQSAPDINDTARIVVKTSRTLGDYQTECMALRELIHLSAHPAGAFEELGKLQNLTQGDVYNYSKTLVSKYLVCNTEEFRNDLKKEMSRLFSIPNFYSCLSPADSWAMRMMQHTLEGNGSVAKEALEAADKAYQATSPGFQRKIDEKMPAFKWRVHQTSGGSRNPSLTPSERQDRQDRLICEQKILDAKKKRLEAEQDDDQASLDNDSEDFQVTVHPRMLDGKIMTVSFKDAGTSSARQEVSYQLDTTQDGWELPGREAFNRYRVEPRKHGYNMRAERVHVPETPSGKKSANLSMPSGPTLARPEETLEEKHLATKRILGLLEAELTDATEYARGKDDDTANIREYLQDLQNAIYEQKKEIQEIEKWKRQEMETKKGKGKEQMNQHDVLHSEAGERSGGGSNHGADTPAEESQREMSDTESDDGKEKGDFVDNRLVLFEKQKRL
ncbi:hypothetical protein F4818DRAFT_363487 [Hypoxylon cercidicola]|nr:hypothetical protein F4818DRAFT_363487 [Hypoxylon cercidicola]